MERNQTFGVFVGENLIDHQIQTTDRARAQTLAEIYFGKDARVTGGAYVIECCDLPTLKRIQVFGPSTSSETLEIFTMKKAQEVAWNLLEKLEGPNPSTAKCSIKISNARSFAFPYTVKWKGPNGMKVSTEVEASDQYQAVDEFCSTTGVEAADVLDVIPSTFGMHQVEESNDSSFRRSK